MLEAHLRPWFQKWLISPFLPLFRKWHPQWVTLTAGVMGVSAAITLVFHRDGWAIGLLLLSGYFDIMDGTVARSTDKTSILGTVFDIMTDRVVEFSIIVALFMLDPVNRATICLWMLGSMLICITSFLVVGIFEQNESDKSFYYSPGLIERAEAFIFFVSMIIFPNAFHSLGMLFIITVFYTALLRCYEFYKNHKKEF